MVSKMIRLKIIYWNKGCSDSFFWVFTDEIQTRVNKTKGKTMKFTSQVRGSFPIKVMNE